jgi:hypothetical protein
MLTMKKNATAKNQNSHLPLLLALKQATRTKSCDQQHCLAKLSLFASTHFAVIYKRRSSGVLFTLNPCVLLKSLTLFCLQT